MIRWRRIPKDNATKTLLDRLLPKKVLLVMQLRDMLRVHPQMDHTHVCSRCKESVGIFPSGQEILRKYGEKRIEIICNRCHGPIAPERIKLAPGAERERHESIWKK